MKNVAVAVITAAVLSASATGHAGQVAVDANGSFYPATDTHNPNPPTVIPLSGITAGTYIGFRDAGTLAFTVDGSTTMLKVIMSMVFRDAVGAFLEAMKYGEDTGSRRQALDQNATNCPDVPADFPFAWDRAYIVRMPKNAVEAALSVLPCNAGELVQGTPPISVTYTFPNRPKTGLKSASTAVTKRSPDDEPELSDIFLEEHLRSVRNSPDYKKMKQEAAAMPGPRATGCFAAGKIPPPMPLPQYRGWYPNNRWTPAKSKFCISDKSCPRGTNANGTVRKHTGIDLFSPIGSRIPSPVDGIGKSGYAGEYGKIYTVTFIRSGSEFTVMYGHLDKIAGPNNRKVKAGQLIAYSGCGGNASGPGCGKDLPSGGRIDHIHMELVRGPGFTNAALRCDVSGNLTTAPVTPN